MKLRETVQWIRETIRNRYKLPDGWTGTVEENEKANKLFLICTHPEVQKITKEERENIRIFLQKLMERKIRMDHALWGFEGVIYSSSEEGQRISISYYNIPQWKGDYIGKIETLMEFYRRGGYKAYHL